MTGPVQVSMDEAYREACTALGEAIVMQRLLERMLAAALRPQEGAVLAEPTAP